MTSRHAPARPVTQRRLPVTVAASILLVAALAVVYAADPKFFPDDPISREPETADASGAQPWDIDLFYDLTYNLFATPRRIPAGVRAQNVNTIDEVPDSSWFTNRIGAARSRSTSSSAGLWPARHPRRRHGRSRARRARARRPASRRRTRAGETWFVSFDAPANPKAPPARWSSPRRSSGRSATTRSSTS